MVYVPQGSFWVGSGGVENYCFKDGTTTNPFSIISEGAINMANANGSLWAANENNPFNNPNWIETAILPAAFPKGYAGFYCMKYSLTQQQYVDFLNTLSRTQQNTRTTTNLAVGVVIVTNRYVMSNTSTPPPARNGIRCNGSINANAPITFYCDLNGNSIGGEAADGQWLACSYLSWGSVAAYLDWSGLRPMTELEYEKVCRGPVAPVANEYAWGSTSITGAANINNGGAINETSSTVGANAVVNSGIFPMRVGLFASGATTREQSGAGYYGAMELSSNVWERPVTVGNIEGRAYIGQHGNGALNVIGAHDATTWPAANGQGVGFRGGIPNFDTDSMCISNRLNAGPADGAIGASNGGRGVRLEP